MQREVPSQLQVADGIVGRCILLPDGDRDGLEGASSSQSVVPSTTRIREVCPRVMEVEHARRRFAASFLPPGPGLCTSNVTPTQSRSMRLVINTFGGGGWR